MHQGSSISCEMNAREVTHVESYTALLAGNRIERSLDSLSVLRMTSRSCSFPPGCASQYFWRFRDAADRVRFVAWTCQHTGAVIPIVCFLGQTSDKPYSPGFEGPILGP